MQQYAKILRNCPYQQTRFMYKLGEHICANTAIWLAMNNLTLADFDTLKLVNWLDDNLHQEVYYNGRSMPLTIALDTLNRNMPFHQIADWLETL